MLYKQILSTITALEYDNRGYLIAMKGKGKASDFQRPRVEVE